MYPVALTPGHRYIYVCVFVKHSNKRQTDAPPRRNTPRREPLALRDRKPPRRRTVSSVGVQHSRQKY